MDNRRDLAEATMPTYLTSWRTQVKVPNSVRHTNTLTPLSHGGAVCITCVTHGARYGSSPSEIPSMP